LCSDLDALDEKLCGLNLSWMFLGIFFSLNDM